MTELGKSIIELRQAGNTYNQISAILKCPKATICYYCGVGQKEKSKLKLQRFRQKNPLYQKLARFLEEKPITVRKINKRKLDKILNDKLYDFIKGYETMNKITLEELKQKLGENPTCYLTGKPIDISKTRSYELDHITPRSKGGSNLLNNLGIASREANQSKRDLTAEEFFSLCKQVLEHQGYKVTKGV